MKDGAKVLEVGVPFLEFDPCRAVGVGAANAAREEKD